MYPAKLRYKIRTRHESIPNDVMKYIIHDFLPPIHIRQKSDIVKLYYRFNKQLFRKRNFIIHNTIYRKIYIPSANKVYIVGHNMCNFPISSGSRMKYLFIGGNTGFTHMAAALKTPIFGLYDKTATRIRDGVPWDATPYCDDEMKELVYLEDHKFDLNSTYDKIEKFINKEHKNRVIISNNVESDETKEKGV